MPSFKSSSVRTTVKDWWSISLLEGAPGIRGVCETDRLLRVRLPQGGVFGYPSRRSSSSESRARGETAKTGSHYTTEGSGTHHSGLQSESPGQRRRTRSQVGLSGAALGKYERRLLIVDGVITRRSRPNKRRRDSTPHRAGPSGCTRIPRSKANHV